MADLDVVAYLASKGHQGRPAGGPEVAYACFFDCQEDNQSRKKKLYVNTEDGFYTCFVCGASGGTYLLQKHFGDTPTKPEHGEDPAVRRRVLNWAAETGAVMLANNEATLLYLLVERGLSPETIEERKLGAVVPPWSLTGSLPEEFSRAELLSTGLVWKDGSRKGQDYFYNHLLIPYIQRGNVVGMRGRALGDAKAKYLTGQGDVTRLYNVDSLDGADDVIITEGEMDAIVLHQHLSTAPDERVRRIAVIGLSGVNGFPDGAESYFADVKRIFIGFDPDDAGKRAAVKLKERLGATRTRILELPPELPKCDWGEFLLPVPADAGDVWHGKHPHAGHTWQDVMALLGTASGKRLFSMRESGLAWLKQKAENPVGLKLGFPSIDAAIHPGLLPGQVMVVLAKTGAGKSVLLCNLAWTMRDKKILFVSLEMTREEIYERLRRIALFHNPYASQREIEDALSNVWISDENRLSEKDFADLIDEFEVETGSTPDVAFVDYLGYFARGAAGNTPYEKVTNAVMSLKAIAKAGRLAVVSPGQVNRGAEAGKPMDLDDARDSGAIEETADFLLSLWRPDMALSVNDSSDKRMAAQTAAGRASLDGNAPRQDLTGKVHVAVLKSRHGGVGTMGYLLLDNAYLVLVDDEIAMIEKSARYTKVVNNNFRIYNGNTFEEVHAHHSRPRQRTLPVGG